MSSSRSAHLLLVALFIACSFPLVLAQTYYADTTITIAADGSATMSGTSNYLQFAPSTTPQLTSKKGEQWMFSLSVPDTFSEYILTIVLPKNAVLSTVATTSNYRVSTTNGALTVILTGQEQPITVALTYTQDGVAQPTSDTVPLVVGISILIIIAVLGYFLRKHPALIALTTQPTPAQDTTATTPSPKESLMLASLTDRQRAILEYLDTHHGKATQRDLATHLQLPKASLSRNLDGLERKELIMRERKGLTMLIMRTTKEEK